MTAADDDDNTILPDPTHIVYADQYPLYISKNPNNLVTRSIDSITSLRPIIKIFIIIAIMLILVLIFLIIFAFYIQ